MQFADIDFLIIGSGKSATTWLQIQLQSDPAVYMPDPELHYFSRNLNLGDAWYLSQFNYQMRDRLIGEKSNSYLYTPGAAKLIHDRMPHVKLIVQLRNPVERAYSHYCMLYRRGEVGPDIESYLEPAVAGDQRLLILGQFATHLEAYLELFGRDRLLVLFYEGVAADPENQIAQVRSHLGLPAWGLAPAARAKAKDKTDPYIPPKIRKRLEWMKPIVRPCRRTAAFKAVHGLIAREQQYPPLSDDLRRRLFDYYEPSILALEKISGRSLEHWYLSVDATS
ncbi:Sulfotransferase family protein [Roseivivax halotolerans]|uniref:Sulfotransferase family protein n=1 Tax=Roseivivax halotolerans TaxID=93684 RepID=A0A1I5YFI5_9RHOB|nr:sulfotransferase [Roseivivax halotolerans]SFQ42969.1 Sulfotransferase family protein [Roseivivax halotolerans]